MLNNIRSRKILNIILGTLKKRIELKLLKYNKKIMNKLNINKENFESYYPLKNFNNKYEINIENIDINELNLNGRYIGNEGLKGLNKIKFKELKELYLCGNEISNINILEKVNFKGLKVLNLSKNKISDINILEKVNFKGLKELYLYTNQISDISFFERVKYLKN